MNAKQLFSILFSAKRKGGHLELSTATMSLLENGINFKSVYKAQDAVIYATRENGFSHDDRSVLGWAKRIADHKKDSAYLYDNAL